MIVVDSSVWVAASREPGDTVARTLNSLIDADEVALALPVRFELLAGIRRADRSAFGRALSALPVVRPSEDTWDIAERWIGSAADRGHRFGLTDLLIAALANEIGGMVWSLDGDFGRMEGLGMVQLYEIGGGAGGQPPGKRRPSGSRR